MTPTDVQPDAPEVHEDTPVVPRAGTALRCVLGGILMGLANLVPGISGGTMLLAVGIYSMLVEAIANLVALRGWLRSGVVLILVVVPAIAAIVLLSGVAGRFVLEARWVAYSLFIGLTLGGVPVLLRSIQRMTPVVWFGVLGGLCVMALLVFSDGAQDVSEGSGGSVALFGAGIAAGASMLLPGLSGSYVLLLLGQYVVVLSAVDEARAALSAGSLPALMEACWTVLPVAVGAVIGIGLVGIVVRWLLARLRGWTLGVLLGLLIGAVFGLWPFRMPVMPEVGMVIRGVEITSVEQAEAVAPKYWRTAYFTPTAGQIAQAGALVLLGAGISGSIGLLGGREEPRSSSDDAQ